MRFNLGITRLHEEAWWSIGQGYAIVAVRIIFEHAWCWAWTRTSAFHRDGYETAEQWARFNLRDLT